MLLQYKKSIQDERDNVAHLNREHFFSREWTIAHLRLGEMQVLQFLSGVSFSIVRRMEENLDKTVSQNTIREAACPSKYLESLVEPLKKGIPLSQPLE